jgi:putative MATE family efflux protein
MSISDKISKLFKLIRQSVKEENVDATTGSIDKAIVLLAVPMILEMLMESLFAIVDAYFVSKVSMDAVAVVGLTESLLMIVYSLGFGLSMGITATVARRIGEKNPEAAAEASVQSLYLAFFLTIPISLVGIFFSEDLLGMMGASKEVIAEGKNYIAIMLGSNLVIMLLFLINGIFRGAGDAGLSMRTLWIANGINIVLDPCLIFGWGPFPEMGLTGAAVATSIGRGVGVVYQVYHLFRGKGVVQIHSKNWQLRPKTIWSLVKVSSGGTGQFIIASASWIFMMRIMSQFGSAALAGYTLGIRVIVFTILPAWGMSNAASTMVGQNLGAGFPDRAEKSVWRTGFFNMIFMGIVSIIYITLSKPIIAIFTTDPEVLMYGSQCLSIVGLGYIFYAYGMVIANSFNGAGDTRTPTILNLFAFWVLEIPLAYLLAISLGFGPNGVFSAIVISESLLTLAGIIIFRRGKWKTVKI